MLALISPPLHLLPGQVNSEFIKDVVLGDKDRSSIIALCPLCIDPSYELPDGGSRLHDCPAGQSASVERLEFFRDLGHYRLGECFTLEDVEDIELDMLVGKYAYDDCYEFKDEEEFPVGLRRPELWGD